jgi:hypothetical protein
VGKRSDPSCCLCDVGQIDAGVLHAFANQAESLGLACDFRHEGPCEAVVALVVAAFGVIWRKAGQKTTSGKIVQGTLQVARGKPQKLCQICETDQPIRGRADGNHGLKPVPLAK